MRNTINLKQLHTGFTALQKEVITLRSALISIIGKDSEGNYKPTFVKAILASVKEKSQYTFKNRRMFLSELDKT